MRVCRLIGSLGVVMKRRGLLPVWLVSAGVLIVACGLGLSELSDSESSRPPPLSERFHGLTSAPFFQLRVGEACGAYRDRNGACESKLCLTVGPGFPAPGFCSVECDPGAEDACPDGWECRQGSPGWWVCAVPKTHTSGEATLRGAKMPLPRPKKPVLPYQVHPFDGGFPGRPGNGPVP